MKLSMLPIVERTVRARNVVLDRLEALKATQNPDKFVVTINGDRQDEAMLAITRPVVERELKGRLASLDRDLESYGVDVGDHHTVSAA